jgi:hypothetical protein
VSSSSLPSEDPSLQTLKRPISRSQKTTRRVYSVRKVLTSASRFLSPLIRSSSKPSVSSSHHHKTEDNTNLTVQQLKFLELPSPIAEISSSAYSCTELDSKISKPRATVRTVPLPIELDAYPNQQSGRTEQEPQDLAPNADNHPTNSSAPFCTTSPYPRPLISSHHNLANSSRSMQYNNSTAYTLPETRYAVQPDTSHTKTRTDGCTLSCSTVLCELLEKALQNSTCGSLDWSMISELMHWLDDHQALIAECPPENLDLTRFLARTLKIDLVLGPWLRRDQSEYRCIQATDVVVIQQLLQRRFGQTDVDNCQGTDGNALCGLWFLRST